MAWRHLRIGEVRPMWPQTMTFVALFLLVVGLGFAAYSGFLGTDTSAAEAAGYLPGELLERQHSFGILAAISLAIGSMLLVFASLARVFNLLATVITMSVLLGCMNLVVVLSLMSGLEQDLRDKILNQKAHIRVSSRDGSSFSDYMPVVEALAQAKGVVGVNPFVRGEVALRSGSFRRGGVLIGIDSERLASVSNLKELMEAGTYGSLDHPQSVPSNQTFSVTRTELPWRLQHLRKQVKPNKKARIKSAPKPKETGEVVNEVASPRIPPMDTEGSINYRVHSDSPSTSKNTVNSSYPASQSFLDDYKEKTKLESKSDQQDRIGPVETSRNFNQPRRSGPRNTIKDPVAEDSEDSEDWEDPLEVLKLQSSSNHDVHREGNDTLETPSRTDDLAFEEEAGETAVTLDAVLMGRELVKELGARVGSRVQLITPDGRITPAGRVPGVKETVIGGIFYSGMYQYDQTHIYAPLPMVQAFLRRQGKISGIEIKLDDLYQTDIGKQRLQAVLSKIGRDQGLIVETWAELNRNLFAAMFLEKIAMFVALLFVVLVASFGVLASNLMSVLEKAKEIAILKAMGSTDALIRRIFIAEGCCMGVIGVLGGVSVGLTMCWALDRFGFPLSENAYSLDRLPVVVNPLEVLLVSVAAMLIVWASSLYPAHVASRTRPVEGLRQSES